MQKKLNSFKELHKLVKISPGDIFKYEDYYFKSTKKYRDKYLFIVSVDEAEDDVYVFITTSVGKYFKHVNGAGCYLMKGCIPCYTIDIGNYSVFSKKTYIQFNNIADVTHSDLRKRLEEDKLHRQKSLPPDLLLDILRCIAKCDQVERYYKKPIQKQILQLEDELFRGK